MAVLGRAGRYQSRSFPCGQPMSATAENGQCEYRGFFGKRRADNPRSYIVRLDDY